MNQNEKSGWYVIGISIMLVLVFVLYQAMEQGKYAQVMLRSSCVANLERISEAKEKWQNQTSATNGSMAAQTISLHFSPDRKSRHVLNAASTPSATLALHPPARCRGIHFEVGRAVLSAPQAEDNREFAVRRGEDTAPYPTHRVVETQMVN